MVFIICKDEKAFTITQLVLWLKKSAGHKANYVEQVSGDLSYNCLKYGKFPALQSEGSSSILLCEKP